MFNLKLNPMKTINARLRHVFLNDYGRAIHIIEYLNITFNTTNYDHPGILEDEINSYYNLPENEYYELDAFSF